MNSLEIRKRIIDDISRLDWHVNTWRELNKHLPEKTGGKNYEFAKKYFFFIEEFRWMLLIFSVIRFIAITNESDADCATFGKLISALIKERENNRDELKKIKKKYYALIKSKAYEIAKARRAKYYAHNVFGIDDDQSTYGELFDLMMSLVELFDDLADNGLIKPRGPYKYGKFDIPALITDAVNALQKDAKSLN